MLGNLDSQIKSLVFLISLTMVASAVTGCGSGFGGTQLQFGAVNESASLGDTVDPTTPPSDSVPVSQPIAGATPAPVAEDLGICSVLAFNDVIWPSSFDTMEKKSLALSFNITGSFEGSSGWSNLSNNFDGQGISLGLLQQNLGTGSLQPLLLNMVQKHHDVMASIFTAADLASMEDMLDAWNGAAIKLSKVTTESEATLFPESSELSPLDLPDQTDVVDGKVTVSGTAGSVQWALATIFQVDGTTFVPRWKTALKKLAVTPEYRSLQIAAALSIYNKAAAYFKYFKFTELRMMLLMFDFVTQNGGFSSAHKTSYAAYLKAHPGLSESAQALALLEIRLKSVRAAYVTDVRQRKTAIINGKGTVHGESRNLPSQYCYTATQKM